MVPMPYWGFHRLRLIALFHLVKLEKNHCTTRIVVISLIVFFVVLVACPCQLSKENTVVNRDSRYCPYRTFNI